MSNKRISVVIPAYNNDETICATLDSLIGQRLPAGEIIVVDDFSPTPVSDLLGDRYPDVRVIRHDTNKGVHHARNTGFFEVTGDYVLFLDGDDILCPEFLDVAIATLEQNNGAGACFGDFYKCFDENAAPILAAHVEQTPDIETLPKGDGLTFYLNNTGAFIPSFSIYRKSALDEILTDGELFSTALISNEDFHMFVRVLAKFEALHIKNPMGVYFLRPNSISRNQLKIWSTRADAVASLMKLADQLSLSPFNRAFLKKMQATAIRQYARILANGGERLNAVKCLAREFVRSPDLKTAALLFTIIFGLQRKKIEYGGVEY